jgi:hypothetical protein
VRVGAIQLWFRFTCNRPALESWHLKLLRNAAEHIDCRLELEWAVSEAAFAAIVGYVSRRRWQNATLARPCKLSGSSGVWFERSHGSTDQNSNDWRVKAMKIARELWLALMEALRRRQGSSRAGVRTVGAQRSSPRRRCTNRRRGGQ